jgi:hypothetical protein
VTVCGATMACPSCTACRPSCFASCPSIEGAFDTGSYCFDHVTTIPCGSCTGTQRCCNGNFCTEVCYPSDTGG